MIYIFAIIGALGVAAVLGLFVERWTDDGPHYRDGRPRPGILDE